MNCKLNCTNPDEIEYTITMTATCKEWREFRTSVQAKGVQFPTSLSHRIEKMLIQANKTYRGEE